MLAHNGGDNTNEFPNPILLSPYCYRLTQNYTEYKSTHEVDLTFMNISLYWGFIVIKIIPNVEIKYELLL